MIVKGKDGYTVKSETTGRSFGTYGSREQAQRRLAQVEMFKRLRAKRKASTR